MRVRPSRSTGSSRAALPVKSSLMSFLMFAMAAAQQTGFPVCVLVIEPGEKLVHDFGPANDADKGRETADAFAAANQIRRDAIVFKSPEPARPAKTACTSIECQDDLMPRAPRGQCTDIIPPAQKSGPTP